MNYQGRRVGNTVLYISNMINMNGLFVFDSTYLHQTFKNVCLINTYILIYRHAGCNTKLWKTLWFYCVLWVFSFTIDEYSCLKYCILNKHSLIVCLIGVNISVINIPNMTSVYGRFSYLIAVISIYYYIFETL